MRQVKAIYRDSRRQVLVANSEGVFATDDQVRVQFRVTRRGQWGHRACRRGARPSGATMGFELFDRHDVEELARSAARRALSS